MKHKLISFILAELPKVKKGEIVQIKTLQSAPHYFETTVPHQNIISEEKKLIQSREVFFIVKSYLPDVLLVESRVEINNVFSLESFDLRQTLINECHKISKLMGGNYEMSEEYSIAIVSEYEGKPEQFFNQSPEIVRFLKSEKVELDEDEIAHTMTKQIKYAKNDLAIIGWDGAFLFEPNIEPDSCESTIELIQIANLQLLRYRILDNDLARRLEKVSKLMQKSSETKTFVFSTRDLARSFKEVIDVRSQSITQFEVIEREIKLIGDWYSARLYEMYSKLFRISEWRTSIKDKLNSLEDVYNIVAQNFSITRHQALELIQIILFFVLQAGWFVLIILELKVVLNH